MGVAFWEPQKSINKYNFLLTFLHVKRRPPPETQCQKTYTHRFLIKKTLLFFTIFSLNLPINHATQERHTHTTLTQKQHTRTTHGKGNLIVIDIFGRQRRTMWVSLFWDLQKPNN